MEVLHPHCAGLDVHKASVVACVRHMMGGAVKREVRSFQATTKGLIALSQWLSAEDCTHIVMEGALSSLSEGGNVNRTALFPRHGRHFSLPRASKPSAAIGREDMAGRFRGVA